MNNYQWAASIGLDAVKKGAKKSVKKTKLWFRSMRVAWDCYRCGSFNNEDILFKEGWITLTCVHCGNVRKARVQDAVDWKFSKKFSKKMSLIRAKFNKRRK